jgi:hypothetical protein
VGLALGVVDAVVVLSPQPVAASASTPIVSATTAATTTVDDLN